MNHKFNHLPTRNTSSTLRNLITLATVPLLLASPVRGQAPVIEPPTVDMFVLPGGTLIFDDTIVGTLAGADATGQQDGTGTAARFSSTMQGADLHSSGDLYISDTGNNNIRKVTPAGVVTVFAGSTSGTSGNLNGTGTAASFNTPTDLEFNDARGEFYVADSQNHEVRRVDLNGTSNDLVGTGIAGESYSIFAPASQLNTPISVAVDAGNGILYIMDSGTFKIKKLTLNPSQLIFSTLAEFVGTGSSGYNDATGTSAQITTGGIVNGGDGYLYMADSGNHCIRRIDIDTGSANYGQVTTWAGSTTQTSGDAIGQGTAARFNNPVDISVDEDGYLYVADSGNHKIKRISPTGLVTELVGTGNANVLDGSITEAEFDTPSSIGFGDGTFYITQTGNGRVRTLVQPTHFWVDDPDSGTVSVTLTAANGTMTIDLSGGGSFTSGSSGSASFTISGTINEINKAFGTLTYTPNMGFTGTDTITYSATDGVNSTTPTTANVVVRTNAAPVFTNSPFGPLFEPDQFSNSQTVNIVATDSDGDSIEYSAALVSGSGFISLSGTTLTIDPADFWTGDIEISVTAEDPYGGTTTENFFMAVVNENDVPVLGSIGNQTTTEDTTLNLTLSATDADGDTVTFSATVDSGNVTANVTGTALALIPDSNWSGTATITVTADDGVGGTDSETFTLTVTGGNDDPVLAAIGAQTTNEDVTKTITLSSTDGDGDTVTYSVVVNAGSVVANLSGSTLDLVPNANWFGVSSITVTADDGNGGTDSETFNLTVTAVNDAPVITAIGNQTTLEDTNEVITLVATDPEGDSFTYSVTVNSGNVSASISGSTLTITPDPNWFGTANITVTADDTMDTSTDTFDLTVTGVNDAPVLDPIGNQTTNEDVTATLNLTTTEPDGDSVTYTAVVNSGNVTANVTGATLDLVPQANWSGTANITITVDDGNGGTDSETITLTVNAVNDAPVLPAIGNQTVAEDGSITLTINATDAEGDSLTYSGTINSGNVTDSVSGNEITLTPDPDWNGTANITITVSDGNGGTDTETIDLVVTPVNDAPVLAAIGNQTTNEDTTLTINASSTDAEGDSLTYTAVVNSGNVTTSITGSAIDLIPQADWSGTASITITVDDGLGGTDSETFTLTVNAVNDDPVLPAIGNQTVAEDGSITLTINATDAEGDTLTYSATVNSGNVGQSVTGNQITLTPDPDWNGTASITISVSDGNGGSASEIITLTVTGVNDAPVLTAIGNQTTNEDLTLSLTLASTDADSDPVTYTAVVNSGNVTANVTGTNLDLVPQADWSGTASITVTVNDGNGGTDSETFSLTVTAVNDAPVLPAIGNQTIAEDGSITLTLNATDTEGDSLTYSATINSGNVTSSVTGNQITLTPDPDWNGTSNITITVDDGNGGTDSETITLTVTAVNDAPVLAAIGNQTTNEDVTATINLSSTEVDGDTITYTAVVNSGSVTANISGSTLDLVPDPNWNGTASITITADDGNGGTDSETITLTVNAVNDPATMNPIGNQTANEDNNVVIVVVTNDPEGDPVTLSSTVNSGNVTVTIVGTTVTIVPQADWHGTASVTITADDGNGGTSSESISITITSVEDTPVLGAIGNQTTNEDVTLTFTLNATDGDSDPLTYTAVVNSGNVTANVTGTTLDLVPDPDWNGTANITVTVNDGKANTDTETFNLTVTAVNDAPVLAAIGNQTTNEDVTDTLTLSATDTEGDTLTYSATVNSGNVTANVTGTTLNLVPDPNWNGTANITVTVNDGNGGTDSETFDLTVTSVNDVPVIANITPKITSEDVTLNVTMSATDDDGDTLTFTAVVDSGNVTTSITGTSLDVIPDPDWNGTAQVTVTVSDGNGGTDTSTFNITVIAVNDDPVLAAIGNQTTNEDVTLNLTLSATDVEGDSLTYSAVVNSGNVTANVTGTSLDLVPQADWNGTANITVTVDDGLGGTDTETFNLTVTAVNDVPVLAAIGNQTTNEDVTLNLTLSATDTEGDTLTYTAVVNSGNVTANVSGTSLDLVPQADWNGTANITVTVNDGNGGTDTETFDLTVTAVNDAPVLASIGNQTITEEATIMITLAATDTEGDTLTYTATVDSGNVTRTLTGNQLDITADPDWNGTAQITVTVSDGNGGTDTETFDLVVTPVNDAPVLTAIGNQTTNEDVTLSLTLAGTDVEGDTLTYSAVVNSGTVTANVTGTTLNLVPNPNTNGTASITVTVNDGNGGTDTETFTLTITAVNDAPVLAAIGNQTMPEDATMMITLAATDVEGDTLTYTATVDSGNMTRTLTGNQLDLVPDPDWNGTAQITVTVDDGNGGTDTETFNVVVTPVNDVPVLAAIGNQTTNEDVTLNLTLSATDADGDTLTYSAVVNSGDVTANVTGTSLDLVPDPDTNGTASITVTVSDGNGGTDTETFTLTVTAVNDAPVLAAITNQTTPEDTTRTITMSATDADGDTLTYSATVNSGNISANVTGTTLDLVPDPDWNGLANVTVTVSDGNGGTDTTSFNLAVTAVNDDPVLAAIGNQTTNEDVTLNLTLSATDVENDTLTYSAVVNSGNVTANVTGTSLDLVPDPDWNGTANITVTVSDGNGGTDSETFDLVVSSVNDVPVLAAIGNQTTNEDVTLNLTLSATDADGDTLTYSAAVNSGNASANVTGTSLDLVPDPDWNGTANITVTVNDGNGGTDTETFDLVVTAVNDAPVLAAIGNQTTNEDVTLNLTLSATDAEGDSLTYTAVVNSGDVTANVTGTSLDLVPDPNTTGTASITVTVDDGNGGTDTETFTLTVTAVNDAPVLAAIGNQTTNEDVTLNLTLSATDDDGDSLTYSAVVNSGNVTANVTGTSLDLVPDPDWNGTANITVTVNDGNGGTDTETFDLVVSPVNDAPVLAAIGNQTTNEDVTLNLTLSATDAENDTLTYSAAVNSGNVTANVTGTSLDLVPDPDWNGTANITVTVNDGNGGTDTETFDLVVTSVNDAPVLAAIGNQTTNEDVTLNLTLSATDTEGDTLTYSAVVNSGSVTANVTGTSLDLVPDPNTSGTASITVTVNDGNGGTDTETFTLTVTAVNDAPVLAAIGNQTTNEDVTLNLTLSATDVENDTLTYSAVVNSGSVSANVTGTSLDLVPDPDWNGTANITVTVNDGNGGTDTETFDLVVTSVNDAPVLAAIGNQTTNEDVTLNLTLSATDTEGDTLTYSAVVNSGNVTANVTGTSLDLVPDPNTSGTASITVTVNDGNGGTDTETFTLTVTAVNDDPVLAAIGNQTMPEDATMMITLAATDTEGDTLTYTATVDSGNMTRTLTGNQLDLAPDPDWNGTAQITVTVDDGNGGTDTETFNVVVTPVNDAPVLAAIGNQSTDENVTETLTLSATDADGDTLTYSATVNSGNVTANLTGTTLNLVPDLNWTGTASITVTVDDGNGGTDSETFSLTVNLVNVPPVLAAIGNQTTNEDVTETLTLSATDGDGDTLTYSAVVNSGNVSANVTGTSLDLVPTLNWNGTANITVTVDDGNGGTDSETFDLVVTPVNDPATMDPIGPQTANEDNNVVINVVTNDPEGDPVTLSSTVNSGNVTVTITGTTVTIIPQPDWNGTASVTITADDGNGGTTSQTVTITVTSIEDTPVLGVIGDQTTTEDTTLSLTLSASDGDGDPLTFSAVVNSGNVSANVTGTNLDLVPDPDWSGTANITVTVNDGKGNTDTETFDLTVTSVNDAPVLAAIGNQTMPEDATMMITLAATDGDGDTLTYAATVDSGNMTRTLTGNQLDLVPDPDWNGTAVITVTVSDGNGGTDTETFNVVVTPVNDAPVLAGIGNQTTNEDVTLNLTLSATDVENDTLTYTAVVNSGDVTANVTGTSLDLIPDPNTNGTASITVTVSDGNGGTDSETFTLTVSAVNDVPVLAAIGNQTTNEDVTLNLTLSATDADGDSLTYTAVVNSGNASANVTGTSLDLVPDPNWNGTANITVTVDDGNGGTDSETFDLVVTAVNDAPVLAAIGNQTTPEDVTLNLTLSATDAEGDTVTYSAAVNSGNVSANVTGTSLDLVPDPDWNGTANITVTSNDGNGGTDTETFDLVVTAVNDAPVLAAIGNQTTNEDVTLNLTLSATDTENDTLTYSAAVNSGDVSANVTGTSLDLVPDPDWNGTANITVTVNDGNGGTDTETFDLVVTAVNDAPVLAAIGNQTTPEDVTLNLTLSSTDVEGDTVTYTAVVNSGSVTANVTGTSLDLVPDPDWNGTANIIVTANDGNGGTDTETFDLVVTAVNDAPVLAAIGNQTTNEDVTLNLTLSATDVEGDTVTYTAVVNSGNVSANVSGTSLDLVPDPDWNGTANITVTANDGNGGTDTETFDLVVTAVNDAPVLAAIGNQTTPEDITLNLTLSSTDAEGDTVTYTAVVNSGDVTANVTGTSLDLVPDPDWNGTANITVTANDGNGGTDTETFDLVVTPVNDDPVLAAIGNQTTNEDVTLNLTLSATDVEGDTLTYSAAVNSGSVTANVTGTSLDLVPDPDWNGNANITVTVNDGNGGTDTETFDLVVAAVNDDPVLAAIGNQSTNEDVTTTVALTATDPDGDTLTYSAVVDSGSISATISGTTLTLDPDNNWNGTAQITVTVTDGNGGSDTETFNLVVTPVNDAPVLNAIGNQTTPEDTTLNLTLSANDVEGDTLTYTATVNSGNVTANVTGTSLDLVPDPDWNGIANITVTVDDGNTGSNSETFNLTVTPVNDNPVLAIIGDQTTPEDVNAVLTLSATDPDGNSLMFIPTVNSGNVSANVSGSTLNLVPGLNWNGTASITVTVDDGFGGTDSETFDLTVTPVNDAPIISSIGNQTTNEDTPATVNIVATDAESDPITLTAVVNSGNVTASILGTTLTLTPDPDWNGTANITVTADDGLGGSSTETFNLTVNPVNDDPVFVPIPDQTIAEDTPATVVVTVSDPEGSPITLTSSVSPGGVTVTITGNNVTVTPNPDWTGTATITITADDGNGGTVSDSFDVTVTPVNDAPVLAAIGNQTTGTDVTRTLNLSATDAEGDSLTYSYIINSGSVTGSLSGNVLNLNPNLGWNGIASITVTVDDGNGGTDSETFTLTVTDMNTPPVLAPIGNQTTPEDTPATINLSSTDADLDTVTYSVTVNAGSITGAVSGNQLTLTPSANWHGTATVTVTADDGEGGTDTETLDLVVTPVNDLPTFTPIANQTVAEDTPVVVVVNASDEDGDTLTYSVTVNSGNVTASFTGNQLTVTPAADWTGTANITVTVDDGNGGVQTSTFTVTVTAVNDAPVLTAIGNQTTPQDTPITLTLNATDAEGDTITYSASVNSGDVTTSVTGNQLTLTPGAGWSGIAAITVTASDGNGGTVSETFNLSVAVTNDPPTAITLSNNTVQELLSIGSFVGNLSATDPDNGDTHTYALVSGTGDTGNGSFSIQNGNQLVTNSILNFGVQSNYSVRIQVTDSANNTFADTFTINVQALVGLTQTLSVAVAPVTGGTVTGAGTYAQGGTAVLIPTENTGYSFAGWTGDLPTGANAGANPLSVTMDVDRNITAHFARKSYNVEVSVFPKLHGYVNGGGTFQAGSTITLNANEIIGIDNVPFGYWKINGVDETALTNPIANLTVDQDMIVEAVFDIGLPSDFVLVPGREYTRENRSRYQHTMTTDSFYIRKHETPKDEWYTVYNWAILNGYTFEFDPINATGKNLAHTDPRYLGDFPITGVTWNDMIKWCNARSEMEGHDPCYYTDLAHNNVHRSVNFTEDADYLTNDHVIWRNKGYRLPTEAEWELAARGGFENLYYPNGITLDETQAYFNQPETELPITFSTQHSREPNGYGLYDMAGNSWEACWDWWTKYWYSNPNSTLANTPGPYLSETKLNTNFKAIRGGSGWSNNRYTRINTRFYAKVWDNFAITLRPVFAAPSTQDATIRAVTAQGYLGDVTGSGVYQMGGTATLVATPDANATFVEWQDENGAMLSTSSTYLHTANEDATITAIFQETIPSGVQMFSISALMEPSGKGYITGQGRYVAGSVIPLTATPINGYIFTGWFGDVTGTSNPINITVGGDINISAMFEKDIYSMDSDGDGLSDELEKKIGSDPYDSDTDDDYLPDGLEINTFGSNPNSTDTDGDGYTDTIEYYFQTSLTDPDEYPFFPKKDLIRHFPISGSTEDISVNQVDGIATDALDTVGRFGDPTEGYAFNGTSTFIEVDGYNGATGSTGRTYTGWVRTAPGNSGPLLSFGTAPNAFSINITPAGVIEVEVDAATLTGATSITDTNWHQYVVVVPGGSTPGDIIVYIDGSVETTTNTGNVGATINTITNSNALIGTNAASQFYTGDMDEIRMYERAFAGWEVTELFNDEDTPPLPEVPLVITSEPETVVIKNSDPVTFTIGATYGVAPIFQWEAMYGNKWEFIPGATGQSYTIPETDDYSGRSYRGSVIDYDGNVIYTKRFRLYIFHPPSLEQPEPDVSFLTNRGGKIVPQTEGTKVITWEWFKDGTSLGTTTKDAWIIPRTANQAQHGGEYHYIATNSVGTMTSNTFTVSIIDPVGIATQPENTWIVEGESGSLSVVATGGGDIQYQWLKYNPSTRSYEKVEGATSATWNIPAMTASLNGSYSVEITNGPSNIKSRRVNLDMFTKPVFSTQPTDLWGPEMAPMELTAWSNAVPDPDYQWEWFNSQTNQWVPVSRATRNNYLIKRVTAKDAGSYRLKATNPAGTTYSDVASITVYHQPIFTQDLQNVSANEDTTITLTVSAMGLDANGTDVNYQWFFNGEPITDTTNVSGSSTQDLYLSYITREEHSGLYYCEATNAIGTTRSRPSRLTVVEAPEILTSLSDLTLQEGQQLYLGVRVIGTKPMSIQWYKNGTPIPGAIYTKLIIANVYQTDTALYKFRAWNAAGSTEIETYITVNLPSSEGSAPSAKDASQPDGDADNDGLSNLLEEALGSDPLDPTSTFTPNIEIVEDGNGELFVNYHYTVKTGITASVVLQESTDLQNWETVDLSEASITTTNKGDVEEFNVYLPTTDSQKFYRLNVEK